MKTNTFPQSGYAVRYETAICDADGRVERVLQRGHNMITDWGMNALAVGGIQAYINYLHCGSTIAAQKRVVTGGTTITLTLGNPASIPVVATANFFEAADVGRTLKINAYQELLVTAYTDPQNVTCSTRAGEWLPGFTATAGPFSVFGVHYTNVSTIATPITQQTNAFLKFMTYDTGSVDYNTCRSDSANSRNKHLRIFLSAAVTASTTLTVNQLGWSDGVAGNNCFGLVNLASPDVIPELKKYRVALTVYATYTPIDIAALAVDWGAVIGSYTVAIRQERVWADSRSYYATAGQLQQPHWEGVSGGSSSSPLMTITAAPTLAPILWQDDAGWTASIAGRSSSTICGEINALTYTAGQHKRIMQIKLLDTVGITNISGIQTWCNNFGATQLVLKFTTPLTKPSGYWCDLKIPKFWTRELTN